MSNHEGMVSGVLETEKANFKKKGVGKVDDFEQKQIGKERSL
jgi:hypothetical protein